MGLLMQTETFNLEAILRRLGKEKEKETEPATKGPGSVPSSEETSTVQKTFQLQSVIWFSQKRYEVGATGIPIL